MPLLRLIGAAVVAAAGAVLVPAALTAAAGAAPATAVVPSHVAIVVAGDRSACVPWKSGMTGDTVLQEAGFRLGYNQSGLITQIDGVPANPNPYKAYWAYFRNTDSGWKYSGLGPASTHPAAGSVEGWVYDPASGTPAPPPAASYATICAGRDHRAATRSPAPPRHSPAPAASSLRPAVTHRTGPPPLPATTRASAPVAPSHRLAKRAARVATVPAASTTESSPPPASAPGPSTGASADATTASTSPAALAHRASDNPSGRPALATALAVAVVAALGGLALWRARGGHHR